MPSSLIILIGLALLTLSALSQNILFYGDLTRGQGYNTFLGRGTLHGAVTIRRKAAKRSQQTQLVHDAAWNLTTSETRAFSFTAPSANMSGIDLLSYFTPSHPKLIMQAAINLERAKKNIIGVVTTREQASANLVTRSAGHEPCNRAFKSTFHLTEDYESYLQALGISASGTISSWGQSASTSGDYLNQAKFEKSTLTYIAIIEAQKELNTDESFQFNNKLYNEARFHNEFGDRWIRGFQEGGKLIARISLTSREKGNKEQIKAHAQASLKFWGARGELSANVKKNIEELDKHAKIDVSVYYQGDVDSSLVQSSPEQIDLSTTEVLRQAKVLSDRFIENVCNHGSKYQAVLDKYETIGNFPRHQKVIDYEIAHAVAYIVLKERVKVSEMTKLLQEAKHVDGELKLQIKYAEIGINVACKKWFEHVALRPYEALDLSLALMKEFEWNFYDKYRKYLMEEKSVILYQQTNFQGRRAVVQAPAGKCINVPREFNDQTASVQLRITAACSFYKHSRCEGDSFIVWGDEADIPHNYHRLSDSISSFYCTPPEIRQQDEKCGPVAGNHACSRSLCCSNYGYCGRTPNHCRPQSCQKGFGMCPLQPQLEAIQSHVTTRWSWDKCRTGCSQRHLWGRELIPLCEHLCDEENNIALLEDKKIEAHVRLCVQRKFEYRWCTQKCHKSDQWRQHRREYCAMKVLGKFLQEKIREDNIIKQHASHWISQGLPLEKYWRLCRQNCHQPELWWEERDSYCREHCDIERNSQEYRLMETYFNHFEVPKQPWQGCKSLCESKPEMWRKEKAPMCEQICKKRPVRELPPGSHLQRGIPQHIDCVRWALVFPNDGCDVIASRANVSAAQVEELNTSNEHGCRNLYDGSYACVEAQTLSDDAEYEQQPSGQKSSSKPPTNELLTDSDAEHQKQPSNKLPSLERPSGDSAEHGEQKSSQTASGGGAEHRQQSSSPQAPFKHIPAACIVVLKKGLKDGHLSSHIKELQDKHNNNSQSSALPFNVTHSYFGEKYNFHAYAGIFHHHVIDHINQHSLVHFIEEDVPVPLSLATLIAQEEPECASSIEQTQRTYEKRMLTRRDEPLTVQTHVPWNLHAVSHRFPLSWLVPNTLKKYHYDSRAGQGTFAYVVDSGVRLTHKQFGSRAKPGCDFTHESRGCGTNLHDYEDSTGHGTHIAGIIASETYGIARKATIVSVKVFARDSAAYRSDILKAFDWATNDIINKGRIDKAVINMSGQTQKFDALNTAIDRAYDGGTKNIMGGIITVASAGNDGKTDCYESPASATRAITVGSIDKDWSISPFSNCGPNIDIFAPGGSIVSLSHSSDFGVATRSGTSMSAPHVTGLILTAMSVYNKKGLYVKDWLRQVATKGRIKGNLRGSPNLLANNGNSKQKECGPTDDSC